MCQKRIVHIWMELYMWEKRYRQFKDTNWNHTCGKRGTSQELEPYMWENVIPGWRCRMWGAMLDWWGYLHKCNVTHKGHTASKLIENVLETEGKELSDWKEFKKSFRRRFIKSLTLTEKLNLTDLRMTAMESWLLWSLQKQHEPLLWWRMGGN